MWTEAEDQYDKIELACLIDSTCSVSGLVVVSLLLNQCCTSVLEVIREECRIFGGENLLRKKLWTKIKTKYSQTCIYAIGHVVFQTC